MQADRRADGASGSKVWAPRASGLLLCAVWRTRIRWARAETQALVQNDLARAFGGLGFRDDVRRVGYGTTKSM